MATGKKSFLYRIFGIGRLPARERAALEPEGVVLVEDGLSASVTYRNYRAPGKRFLGRKSWFPGSLVVTGKRLVAFGFSRRLVNLAFDDPRFAALEFAVEDGRRLCIAFEASTFDDDRSGTVEFRFATPHAGAFLEAIQARCGHKPR